MKKVKWISAVTSAALVLGCTAASSVSAYTKDDIYSMDEHSVTFYYHGADFDLVTVADTEDGCKYIWTGETGYSAIVMENESCSVDESELLAIGDGLTAVAAEEFDYPGRYCGEYGKLDLDDLDLSRTYIIEGSGYDRSALHELTGVIEVYEMTATTYSNGWVGSVNSNEGEYVLWAYVPEGTEFTVDDCSGLPYTVTDVQYKQTYNGIDSYDVLVEYDRNDTRFDDPKYKSIFDMQLAMMDMLDGNVNVTAPLVHMMTVGGADGLYLLTEVEPPILSGDLNTTASWWEKSGLSAEFIVPDGFTDFTATDTYKEHMEYFSEAGVPAGAPLYLSNEYPCYVGMYVMYYNNLFLKVTDDGWQEIYDKYSRQLDMASCEYNEKNGSVSMNDYVTGYGADGVSDYELQESIPVKFELMAEMCSEMYEAGCIESASYKPYYGYNGTHFKALEMKASGISGTADEFAAVVSEEAPYAEVSPVSSDGSAYAVEFPYESASIADFFNVIDGIQAEYPDAEISAELFNYEDVSAEWYPELPDVSAETVDILTLFADDNPADLNADGKTSILDIITLSKAASGIITLNEARTSAADLNSDGAVNGDDLTILMQYLVGLIDTL